MPSHSLRPEFLAAIRRLPGLQDTRGGIDREGGRASTVATFDTREHAAFPQEALGPVLAGVLALGVRVESREVYEVFED